MEKNFEIIQANHQPRTTSIIKKQKTKQKKPDFPNISYFKNLPCFPRDASSPGLGLEHLRAQPKRRKAGGSSLFPGMGANSCPSLDGAEMEQTLLINALVLQSPAEWKIPCSTLWSHRSQASQDKKQKKTKK